MRSPKVSLLIAAALCAAGLPSGGRLQAAGFDWKQASGTKITVAFNQHPYADAIIQRLPQFKELTGIDVSYEVTPEENYFDKVTTNLSASSGVPDVFMTGVYQMWDYSSSNRMEPLDKYVNDPGLTSPDYNPNDFLAGVFSGGKWNLKPGSPPGTGSLYSVPLGFEMYSLIYNKKYFDEKGLKPPETLDELIDLAKKLKDWNGPGSYGVAVRGTRNWATIHPGYMSIYSTAGAKDFVVKDGKLVAAMDSPEAIEVTRKFAEMVKEGGPPAWSNYTWYQCGADLGAGKAAILWDADINGFFQNVPGSTSQSGNLAVSPTPVMTAGQAPQSNEWVWQLGMNATSKNKKAAWLFMQYFTGPEFELWAALNAKTVDPARQSIWDNQQFKDRLSKYVGYVESFQKTIPNTSIKFTPQPYFIQSTTEWAATLQKIVLSGADPGSALKDLAKRITRDTSKLKLTQSTQEAPAPAVAQTSQ
ncbi:MAG: sugar ABC transporter substrate-binding protein [Verrucomicrobia bacterium]|nr:sugar ABC transporter substrate-binding protein [Verrucomicrobiota bacterium]